MFNTTMVVQFHPQVVTAADQALAVDCLLPAPVLNEAISEEFKEFPKPSDCNYRILKGHQSCLALDGSVGETVSHQWKCKLARKEALHTSSHVESYHSKDVIW